MVSISFVFQVKILFEVSIIVSLLTLSKLGFKLKVIWEDYGKEDK
jgi:hypothetical protein